MCFDLCRVLEKKNFWKAILNGRWGDSAFWKEGSCSCSLNVTFSSPVILCFPGAGDRKPVASDTLASLSCLD